MLPDEWAPGPRTLVAASHPCCVLGSLSGQLLHSVSDLRLSPALSLELIGGGIHHQEGTIVRVPESDVPLAVGAAGQDPGVCAGEIPAGILLAGDSDGRAGEVGESFGGCVGIHFASP